MMQNQSGVIKRKTIHVNDEASSNSPNYTQGQNLRNKNDSPRSRKKNLKCMQLLLPFCFVGIITKFQYSHIQQLFSHNTSSSSTDDNIEYGSSPSWLTSSIQPRMVHIQVQYNDDDSGHHIEVNALNINAVLRRKKGFGSSIRWDRRRKKDYLDDNDDNSNDERFKKPDTHENEDCKPKYDWQIGYNPTCNDFHEQNLLLSLYDDSFYYVGSGSYRDVWSINDSLPNNSNKSVSKIDVDGEQYDYTPVALKTLVYRREYNPRNYDRHRRDAVATEKLTFSPYVTEIYSHCGNSGLFEFGIGGTLDGIFSQQRRIVRKIRRTQIETKSFKTEYDDELIDSETKLIMAYQVVAAISAVHNSDRNSPKGAAIAHTDISTSQFLYVPNENIIKLNDFNRCRLLYWDVKQEKSCPFTVGANKGEFRSPEEYKYLPETEKVDIYSMGNILFMILNNGKRIFSDDGDYTSKQIQKMVKKGKTPNIPEEIQNSNDKNIQTILKAMNLCWEYNPEKRTSALQIKQLIEEILPPEKKRQFKMKHI